MESQNIPIAKGILRKKDKAGGIMCPNFKLHYKATVIKTVWYQHQNQTYRSMKQKRDSPNKTNPHICGQLIYDKGGKDIQ